MSGVNTQGYFWTYNTSLPSDEMLVRIERSIQFRTVNTEMIAKIPMVIPSRVRKVRSLFTRIACIEKRKLSFNNRRKIIPNRFKTEK